MTAIPNKITQHTIALSEAIEANKDYLSKPSPLTKNQADRYLTSTIKSLTETINAHAQVLSQIKKANNELENGDNNLSPRAVVGMFANPTTKPQVVKDAGITATPAPGQSNSSE